MLFHTPSRGGVGLSRGDAQEVRLDGATLEQWHSDDLGRHLGYLPQNVALFDGTIAENIAGGSDEPDRRRIEEVAKRADAHGFISKLPLGYQQVVGERGTGLSGGQIQRLCIARALYRDPRLLVFDEATSALDSESESNIIANLSDILKGRTAVVIAHRLSTILRADKILVLYDGKIVEQGRHGLWFFLIEDGQAEVVRDGVRTGLLGPGERKSVEPMAERVCPGERMSTTPTRS